MERLFVYGTLGPGRPNEHVMQKIGGEWQAARVKGKLIKAGWGFAQSGFPAMVPSEDGEDIEGHVFQSAHLAAHWKTLDNFEGADYVRVLTKATLDDGAVVDAYVYALAAREAGDGGGAG
jgi:gamma-glutamylcyclotransferase (GGCT)/AIG2-like uncharacterized protein YtfP